jgi:anti-sigma regulatory factor (Ser/Thr protein kinase)
MCSASVVLVNRRKEIERLGRFMERFGEQNRLPADEVLDTNLVLDEIIINIIAHGYDDDHEHQIHVSLALDAGLLTIQIEDDGRPFNLLEAPPPNLDLPIEERPIGGLGIHIVRSLTETIEHRLENGWNVLTLKRRISGGL